ncbi:hypothetical protein FRC02_003247 [Tulasnella sp. 418]|nr:hypothetical protein FRC02_003247 [Tulasnella sp. 418]
MSFGKRKHANDDNDDQYQPVPSKQLRLSIARGAEENDVAMNDVENLVNFVPFPSSYSPITEGSHSPSPSYSLSTLPSTSSHSSRECEIGLLVCIAHHIDIARRTHSHSRLSCFRPLPRTPSRRQHGCRCPISPSLPPAFLVS